MKAETVGALFLPVVILVWHCRAASPSSSSGNKALTNNDAGGDAIVESIGAATMTLDGTIVLQLRATDGATLGDGLIRYPPSHRDYEKVFKHLGGLKPGESKPVPPFPENW